MLKFLRLRHVREGAPGDPLDGDEAGGSVTSGSCSATLPASGVPPTICPATASPRGSVTPKLVQWSAFGQLSTSAAHAVPSEPMTTSRKSPTFPQRTSPQAPIQKASVAESLTVVP